MKGKVNKEKERFKAEFFNELLEYHFERLVGKNNCNHFPWRVLLEDKIQPHTDILCDFSRWLIEQGWDRDVIQEHFFIVVDNQTSATEIDKGEQGIKKTKRHGLRRFFSLFRID